MKYFSFFFILNLSTAFCQNFILKGRVSDSISNEPIQGAVVFISSRYMSYTNHEGYYTVKDIAKGYFSIEVVQLGYESFSGNINIPGDSVKNFSLLPSPIELGEVVVSTSRVEKQVRNSPYSELLIGSGGLQNRTFQSLPEALKSEPGISLISEGAWGTEVSIRGLNRENVVALIDGNRISTSTDVAARFSLVDLNDIERVEIIKGASSALYGSGATGGIVNIITKSPPFNNVFSINGNISSGYNSVNNSTLNSVLINSSGNVWASKISGSFRKAADLQTPSGKLNNSQFSDFSLTGNLNLAPSEDHLIKFNYQLFKANDVGIPGSSVFPNNADVRYPEEKRELFSAGYEIQNISSVLYRISLKYSYQYIERDVENIPHTVQNIAPGPASPARRVSVLKITPNADHRSNNFQVFGNLLPGESNNLVLGIDYWDRQYRGERRKYQLIEILNPEGDVASSTNRIIGEKPLPDSKFQSFGVFAQDDEELIRDKLLISFGARADKIDVKGETTLNPVYEIINGNLNNSPSGQQVIWNKVKDTDYSYSTNIGMKYSLINNFDLTLSLGLSFRSPSLEERFQFIDQGSVVRAGNPNLNPEKGKSADLGLRYYSSRLKIITSFFFNYFDDLVAEIPGTFEGRNAFIKTNIGESRLYGFDFNADYNFVDHFVLFFQASYVKGDDITAGGNLPEMPPLNGRTGIKYNLSDYLQTELFSDIFAQQKETADGEIKTPGYAVFGLALNSDTFNSSGLDLKISAGMENILNKNYRNHLSTARGSITAEPGRNIYLKLTLNF